MDIDQIVKDLSTHPDFPKVVAQALARLSSGSSGLGIGAGEHSISQIYVNRTYPSMVWYMWRDGQPVEIPSNTIVGRVIGVGVAHGKSDRYSDNKKIRVRLDCGDQGLYQLEFGYDTSVCKSVLSSLSSVLSFTDPIKFSFKPADKEDKAVFADLYQNNQRLRSEWNRHTDVAALYNNLIQRVPELYSQRENQRNPEREVVEAPVKKQQSSNPFKSRVIGIIKALGLTGHIDALKQACVDTGCPQSADDYQSDSEADKFRIPAAIMKFGLMGYSPEQVQGVIAVMMIEGREYDDRGFFEELEKRLIESASESQEAQF